ncbi:LppX_LprAFG lipoprotein [Nocardioides sp. LML1-1-1.1]|uniref:LppX_LprAFG lipoprotein n=1 Tax=Nocardioides sp. LML1-1-1.1 TaxID=3135248 RepID=UPI0034146108
MTTSTRVAAGLLTGLFAVSGLTACSGDGGGKGGGDDVASWSDASAEAKKLLDGTSGVELSISTKDDPGGNFLKEATGTIVADPATFEGKVSGSVSGLPVNDVPVISADGTLWINHALLGGWSDKYQPKELCAPDPATLLDPETGVSTVLTSSKDVEAGKAERGGEDNKEIFTTYSGTATGDAIRAILPCAEGDEFDATYRVDDKGYLRSARLTGVFFPDSDAVTYTIDVTKYDVTKDITAPK